MKKNVLIIGAGGVAQVVAHKCAQNNDVLGDIHIASRTLAKCRSIVDSVREKNAFKTEGAIEAHQLDAFDVEATKDGRTLGDKVGSLVARDPSAHQAARRRVEAAGTERSNQKLLEL